MGLYYIIIMILTLLAIPLIGYLVLALLLNIRKSKTRNPKSVKVAFFHPFWYMLAHSAMMVEEAKKFYGLWLRLYFKKCRLQHQPNSMRANQKSQFTLSNPTVRRSSLVCRTDSTSNYWTTLIELNLCMLVGNGCCCPKPNLQWLCTLCFLWFTV